MKLIAVVAASLLPPYAGAGPIDLKQDLGGLDVTVTLVPRDNPDAMRIDNKTLKIISCSAHFTGADENRRIEMPGEGIRPEVTRPIGQSFLPWPPVPAMNIQRRCR
jgi:hypothetical protein